MKKKHAYPLASEGTSYDEGDVDGVASHHDAIQRIPETHRSLYLVSRIDLSRSLFNFLRMRLKERTNILHPIHLWSTPHMDSIWAGLHLQWHGVFEDHVFVKIHIVISGFTGPFICFPTWIGLCQLVDLSLINFLSKRKRRKHTKSTCTIRT
jgi:hypothetical protein